MVVFSSILGLGSPQQPVFVLGSALSQRPLEIPVINGLCHAVSGAKLIPRQRPLSYLRKDGGNSGAGLWRTSHRRQATSGKYFSVTCKMNAREVMAVSSAHSTCPCFFMDVFLFLLAGLLVTDCTLKEHLQPKRLLPPPHFAISCRMNPPSVRGLLEWVSGKRSVFHP